MIERKSVGAIVYRQEAGKVLYLLLHYEAGHWDFVKGGVEAGESEEKTLERECREETGIADLRVVPGFKESVQYFFREEGQLVKKQVVFFLAETSQEKVEVSFEHKGFKWLEFGDALGQLTYKNAKEILEKADSFLKDSSKQKRL